MIKALDEANPGFGLDSRGYVFYDKYKYGQDYKPTSQQIKEYAANRASL